jgi:transglutaminase-like putative cysteine protease
VIFVVRHRTTYEYSHPVSISHHLLHLLPRDSRNQKCQRSSLIVEPAPAISKSDRDYFGNHVTYLTVEEPHRKLVIFATSTVEVAPLPLPDPAATPSWDGVHRALAGATDQQALDAFQYAFDSPHTGSGNGGTGNGAYDYARPSFPQGRPVLEAAVDLTGRIFRDFTYEGGVTDISTPVDEVLKQRRGVCQDFAHLQLSCLRSLGLPARYVSGYLLTRPPEGKEKLVGSDASHAWVSVWCPGHGWVDLDPTNNLMPGEEHITVAWGRDFGDVSPIKGLVVGGGEHKVVVQVDVAPEGEG